MIITTWCEIFDNERMALWIKLNERRPDDSVVPVEKYSRQHQIPVTGISDLSQLLLMQAEIKDLIETLSTQGDARKYIGRSEEWTEAVLAVGRPFDPKLGPLAAPDPAAAGTGPVDGATTRPPTGSPAGASRKRSERGGSRA